MNVILKKILLEINQKKKTNELGDGNYLLSSGNEIEKNDKIILINDSENDFDDINQKYIFLLKKEKIKIDILSLNELNKNKISKSICLFTNGFFDNVTKMKNNIEQILVQEYMPIERKEIFKNICGKFKDSINYNKARSNDELSCSICHKNSINKEQSNELFNNYSGSSGDLFNRNNSITNSKLYFFESDKIILCNNCRKDKK